MPVFTQPEERFERELRLAEEERTTQLEVLDKKNQHDLEVICEKGKISIERARITHKIQTRAESRQKIFHVIFTIIPKSILIICSFWLILFHREVPQKWNEYLKS